MATYKAPPAVRGGPHLTVSWRRPGSNTWHTFEDSVARATLAASTLGQATFQVGETVRRSPLLDTEQEKAERACAPHSTSEAAEYEEDVVTVTLRKIGDGLPASNSGPAIRWGFSSTCIFDRLPFTARALADMIAQCEVAKKRQVLSELLSFLTSEDRVTEFLARIDISSQPVTWCSPLNIPRDVLVSRTGTLRVSRVDVNERARPGGALYERFLDTMMKHVADLGGALQLLMGSASRSMAPFTLAFHGTSPANVPSILKNGMLPKKRLAGGDWFAPLPFKSLSYCQKPWGKGAVLKGPPYRLILFLLLPVARVDL